MKKGNGLKARRSGPHGSAILARVVLCGHAAGAEPSIHGQITDAVSGNPVAAAWVQVDREPGDESYEADVLTDAFGFHHSGSLATGVYDDDVDGLDDVTPDGDFDGDGMGNAQELDFGYDPADPASALQLVDFTTGDEAAVLIYMPEKANAVLRRSGTVAARHDGPRDIVEIRTNAVGIVTLTDTAVPTNHGFYGVTLER